MSEHDESEQVGLTKPLYNNVGGMVDQDAPSADQLLDRSGSESTWGKTPVERGDTSGDQHDRAADNSGLMPDLGQRIADRRD